VKPARNIPKTGSQNSANARAHMMNIGCRKRIDLIEEAGGMFNLVSPSPPLPRLIDTTASFSIPLMKRIGKYGYHLIAISLPSPVNSGYFVFFFAVYGISV
jgi:hypothetical protein